MTHDTISSTGVDLPSYPLDAGQAGTHLNPRYLAFPPVQPVHLTQADRVAYLVTSYDLLQEVYRDEEVFGPVRGYVPGFFSLDGTILALSGPDHRRIRRPAAGFFTRRATDERQPAVRQQVKERLDALHALGRPVDLVHEFALPLGLELIGEMLGVPGKDWERFAGWGHDFTNRQLPQEQVAEAAFSMVTYLGDLVRARKDDPGDDLISRYLRSEHGRHVSDEELAWLGMTLITAGWESTTGMVTSMLHEFLTHRQLWDQVVADSSLVATAVDEILRTRPAGTDDTPARMATREVVLGGVTIPAGSIVLPSRDAANLDSAVFPDPHVIDLRRPNAADHMAFGGGAHICPGQHMATRTMRAVLTEITAHYSSTRLVEEPLIIPVGASVRCPAHLHAELA